jgi:hypothetical protein
MAGIATPQHGSRGLCSKLAVLSVIFVITIPVGSALSCMNSPSTSTSTSPSQATTQDIKLPADNDTTLLSGVISPPDEGRDHIWPDHPAEYKTMPPTSGPHFPDPTSPGFYTTRPALGYLVHSLEHGSVVIYYDPAQLSPEIEVSLKELIKKNSSSEVGIIAVPATDFKDPFILTAWDKMLRLNKYDIQVVEAFLAAYLGHGPES